MKTKIPTLTPAEAKELLDYDPETGIFRWKRRPAALLRWNVRYAGKVAGSVMPVGYRAMSFKETGHGRIYAHRLAWLFVHGYWPPDQIDHINRNKDDNRIANLRLATSLQNGRNTGLRRVNTSGIRGVGYYAPLDKWRARITINRKEFHLGYFLTMEEAERHYLFAAKAYHGEFAGVSN